MTQLQNIYRLPTSTYVLHEYRVLLKRATKVIDCSKWACIVCTNEINVVEDRKSK